MEPYVLKQKSDAALRQDSSLLAVEADQSGTREVVISRQPSEGIDRLYAPEDVAEEHSSRRIITREADPAWLVRNISWVGSLWDRKEGLRSEMKEIQERLDRRNRKIEKLSASLSDRERELGEMNEMRKRLDRRDSEIATLRESLSDRERESGEMDEMRKRLERRDSEIAKLRESLERESGEMDETRKRLERRDREIAQLRESLSDRDRVLGEEKTLCMYDDCSEGDIASMMGGVNTRIQSLSRNAAQRWCRGISKGQGGGGDNQFLNETEMETLGRILGPQLANALGSHPPERNPFVVVLLQLAWQAFTVSVVAEILSSFVAGLATSPGGRTLDDQLQTISGSVKKGEIQPAYGRWRYITHQYLKRHIGHEEAVQYYVQEALNLCRLAARLALRSSCPDDQTFINTFQAQLTAIMEDAFKLQGSIQEKILTANFDPYLPANGTPFQEDLMEVDKADELFPKDTVVCTTRLGVTLSRKKGRENLWDVEKEVFLKAQVLTEGNLADILGSKEDA